MEEAGGEGKAAGVEFHRIQCHLPKDYCLKSDQGGVGWSRGEAVKLKDAVDGEVKMVR